MTLPDPLRADDFLAYGLSLETVQSVCESASLPIPSSVQRVSRGEVNALFLLSVAAGDDLILKVWVRKPDSRDMCFEKAVIQTVREQTAIPTPTWLYSSRGDENIQYPHVVMEHTPGQDADVCWDHLSECAKRRLMVDCAAALRALHGMPTENVPFGHVPATGDEWAKRNSEQFRMAIREIHDQGWMTKAVLCRCEKVYEAGVEVLREASDYSLTHYDFQPHNLRIDAETGHIAAVLDFENATLAPAITDSRDLNLSLFLDDDELGECFWHSYGALDETRAETLRLHSLTRCLSIMAAYVGPTPAGWDEETVRKLLQQAQP